jgi:hypothetical protein
MLGKSGLSVFIPRFSRLIVERFVRILSIKSTHSTVSSDVITNTRALKAHKNR